MKLAIAALGVVGSLSIAAAQPTPPPAGAPVPPVTPAVPTTPTPPLPPGPTPTTAAPAPAPPPLEAFLRQRVVEELAADGIVLSRLGVNLQLEAIGDKLLVSLIDQITGRASASTKVDQLPADREAAVASVTQVVANLTAQLSASRPPAVAPGSQPVTHADLEARERAQLSYLEARERAQLSYQEQAIGFGDEYELNYAENYASLTRRWTAHRGELKETLAPTDFYRTVGRPDLAEEYTQRRNIKIGAIVGTVVLAGVSVGLASKAISVRSNCDIFTSTCADEEASARTYLKGAGVALLGATVTSIVWVYYHRNPHPISEGEAKRLGAQHNRALRVSLGMPVAAGPTRARVEVGVTPYATAGGGGLALGGRF